MKITNVIALAAISLGIAGTSVADEVKFTVANGHCLYRRVQEPSTLAVYPSHVAGPRQAGQPSDVKMTVVNGHSLYRAAQ
jgi:hypothetical protein